MLTEYDTLVNTGLWREMMAEIIISLIAPYPFLYSIKIKEYVKAFDYTITYDLNELLLFFAFNRVYFIVRFILTMTTFMNTRS